MGSHRVGHDWSDLVAAAAAIGNNTQFENILVWTFQTGIWLYIFGNGRWEMETGNEMEEESYGEMEEESYGKMVKGGRKRGRNNGICEKGKEKHIVSRNVQHTISYAQCRI